MIVSANVNDEYSANKCAYLLLVVSKVFDEYQYKGIRVSDAKFICRPMVSANREGSNDCRLYIRQSNSNRCRIHRWRAFVSVKLSRRMAANILPVRYGVFSFRNAKVA